MREKIFLFIWGPKDLEAYREMSGDFVCPWAPPKGFSCFSSILTVTIEWFDKICETLTPEHSKKH